MATRFIDRTKFILALHEWCNGKYDPKVGFPDKKGFGNIAYLYCDNNIELIEDSKLLEQFLQKKLEMPIALLINPLQSAPPEAMYCSDWAELCKDSC